LVPGQIPGDATRYFVTLLDNYDVRERIRYVDPADPTLYDNQVAPYLQELEEAVDIVLVLC
jgi:hypothetical protein